MSADTHAVRTCNHSPVLIEVWLNKTNISAHQCKKNTLVEEGIVKLHAEDEKATAHHGHWQWHEHFNDGSN